MESATTENSAQDYGPSDLTFIGFGPSNVNVFRDFIAQAKLLSEMGIAIPKLKLTIVDTEGNHGAGKPYGNQCHESSLFNNELFRVTDGFMDWIKTDPGPDHWLPILERFKDKELKIWFEENSHKLQNHEYDDLYFPRFLYGIFKREQVIKAIADAPANIEISMLQGKIVDIEENREGSDRFLFESGASEVELVHQGKREFEVVPSKNAQHYVSLNSKHALLGVGTPEPKRLLSEDHKYYFNSPSSDNTQIELTRFSEDFKQAVREKYEVSGKKVKLCVLGTGASFLDVMNMVANDSELKEMLDISAISSTGLPQSFPNQERINAYQPRFLTKDYHYAETSPAQYIQDVFREINYGVNECPEHYTTQDILRACGVDAIMRDHKSDFVGHEYEVHYIDEFLARTPAVTQHAVDTLDIRFIPGRIKSLVENGSKIAVNISQDFLNTGIPYNKKNVDYPCQDGFDIVVNCMGFNKTTEIPLIKNGIQKNIFKTDQTGHLAVNSQDFSISPTISLNGYLALDYMVHKSDRPFISYMQEIAAFDSIHLSEKLLGPQLALLKQQTVPDQPPVIANNTPGKTV
jgi:uncharacterized NAD(P)/FAD-binding protein YdhS